MMWIKACRFQVVDVVVLHNDVREETGTPSSTSWMSRPRTTPLTPGGTPLLLSSEKPTSSFPLLSVSAEFSPASAMRFSPGQPMGRARQQFGANEKFLRSSVDKLTLASVGEDSPMIYQNWYRLYHTTRNTHAAKSSLTGHLIGQNDVPAAVRVAEIFGHRPDRGESHVPHAFCVGHYSCDDIVVPGRSC